MSVRCFCMTKAFLSAFLLGVSFNEIMWDIVRSKVANEKRKSWLLLMSFSWTRSLISVNTLFENDSFSFWVVLSALCRRIQVFLATQVARRRDVQVRLVLVMRHGSWLRTCPLSSVRYVPSIRLFFWLCLFNCFHRITEAIITCSKWKKA